MDKYKKAAGEKAVDYIESGMTIGLGSGSTVFYMMKKLAMLVKDGLKIEGVPTSKRTENWAKEFGIPLTGFVPGKKIDLAIDGADEIDPHFNLIKGGGGSLVREKIVDAYAQRLIIIADKSKMVHQLGKYSLPVEVLPFGYEITTGYIKQLGGHPKLRLMDDGKPFISNNGNYILDCDFGLIEDVHKLHEKLKLMVGVVETGLFADLTDMVIIGNGTGVEILEKNNR